MFILKGGGFYDRIPAGRDTKNLISGILAIGFDGFGLFFSVGFVFTPIFGQCGVWTTPSAQAAAIINLAVVADLKPQRQKIGIVLVKADNKKYQPNPSKTVVKLPIIRFLVPLPAGNLSKNPTSFFTSFKS